ncbi:MAG TPA: addiction module protein [Ilumatobacteraceae bacterium]|nr:addiction module protein [Ilumatobacteraceae bacterium]
MAGKTVRVWTVEEFFADSRPPTDDDVPIAADGRVLDTPAKVIAYIDEINDIGGVSQLPVDLAWRDELSRRSEQIAAGTVETVGWDQVLERVADSCRTR